MAALPSREGVTFTGNAAEYFGIWIVNLFLTVVTLGIYSAWAKVRKKRYFYGNTWVAGVNFEYHGNPIAILKGRVIAFVLFVAYTAANDFAPKLGSAILLAIIPALPWIIIRSFAFNAVNSSYRNIRFHFKGTYRDALRAIGPAALVPLVTVLLPDFNPRNTDVDLKNLWTIYVPPVVLALVYPWIVGSLKRLHLNGTAFGTSPFACTATIGAFYRNYLLIGLLFIVLVAGFGGAVMLLILIPIVGWLAIPVLYIAFGAFLFAFTQSRIANLVFNATSLGGRVHFESTLKAGKLAKIYAVNLLAIACSLGLAVPWAVIRAQRYRAECLALECEGGLESFMSETTRNVSAVGAEVGEMFDVDLSL